MASIEVTDTGITVRTVEENVAEYEAILREELGSDLALAPETAEGQLATVAALKVSEVSERINAMANGFSRERAVGQQLDDMFSPLDILRLPGSPSTVTLTVTGAATTVIPAGSRVANSQGVEFATVEAVTIPAGGSASVDARAVNQDGTERVGPTAAAAGSLTTIRNRITGWTSVTNAAAAVLGENEESDGAFRVTGYLRTAQWAAGSRHAIRAALYEARAYRQRLVVNDTEDAFVRGGWRVGRGGVLAVVQGGTATDLTRAMLSRRGAGTPIYTAIIGGAADEDDLGMINNGTISFAGTEYTGLDLSSAATPAARAAALTALIDPITVHHDGTRYIAIFLYRPGTNQAFDAGDVATDFGLAPAVATAAPGPFVRPVERSLGVTLTVDARPQFPADGLDRIRDAIVVAVRSWGIGASAVREDLLVAAGSVPGTRISNLAMTSGSTTLGEADPVDLATFWQIEPSAIIITQS